MRKIRKRKIVNVFFIHDLVTFEVEAIIKIQLGILRKTLDKVIAIVQSMRSTCGFS